MEILTIDTGGSQDLNEILHRIAETALGFFSADFCLILAVNPVTKWLLLPPVILPEEQKNIPGRESLEKSARKVLDQQTVFVDDIESPDADADFICFSGTRSLAAISFQTRPQAEPLGVLYLSFNHLRPMDFDDLAHLKSFAEQASSILQSTWLLRRYREVVRIGQEINQGLETPDILFNKLHTEVADILDISEFFMLAVYQPTTNALDLHMIENGDRKEDKGGKVEGFSDYVVKEKCSLLVHSYSKESSTIPAQFVQIPCTKPDIPESLIFVPLLLRDVPLGVLSMQNLEPNAYDEEDLQIMELLGNQVALALSNLRLFKYLQEVNLTSQELTQQLNSYRLLQDVCDRIRKTTGADLVILYPYLQADERFEPPRTSGTLLFPDYQSARLRSDDIAWLALNKEKPVFASDSSLLFPALGGDLEGRKGSFEKREEVASTAAVPLRAGDEFVGALFVNFRQSQRFDAPQMNLIQSLSSFAAIAIKNSRAFENMAIRQVKKLETLRDIDRQISQSLDLQTVLQSILDLSARHISNVNDGAIVLYNPRTKMLEVRAAIGNLAEVYMQQKISVVGKKGLTVKAYQDRMTVRADNVHSETWKDRYYNINENTVSEMDVPLFDNDRVIGVINFESAKEGAFSDEDEDFAETLAGQAVLAIKNAQLYEGQQQIAEELSALREIELEIVSKLNLQEVLNTILEKALRLTESSAGQIMFCDSQRGDLYSAAEQGVMPGRERGRLSKEKGIISQVIKEKKLLNVNVLESPWKEIYERFIPDIVSELAVPIIEGGDDGEVRGIINIESSKENAFTQREESLVKQLADLASIALQNAEQYGKAELRKKRLEALNEVNKKIISQQGDPEKVIKVILENALVLTGAETGSLYLYDAGDIIRKFRARRDGHIEEIKIDSAAEDSMMEAPSVARAAGSKEIMKLPGDSGYAVLMSDRILSREVVSLISSNILIGELDLDSTREYAFDDEHREMLKLFADQAVIAIQHARNFSEAKAESNRFQLLSETGEELGEIADSAQLDLAYDIVVSKIAELNDSEVIIRRYNEESQELMLVRVENSKSEPPLEFIRLDQGVNGQVARERKTVMLSDADNPPPNVATPIPSGAKIKSLLATPIQFKDRYYGNLVLSHEKKNYFTQRDKELMEGLAYQLALTIHRLDVVDAQRHLEMFSEFGLSAYELTHRLGNDLGLVGFYVQKIRDEILSQGIDSAAIDEQLGRLLKGVGNVLKMSKAMKRRVRDLGKDGKLADSPAQVPVVALLEEARWSIPPLPENVRMDWGIANELTAEAQIKVNVVSGQILDILRNLVSNALEAMPDGGEITLRASVSLSWINIEIADTGPGIMKADQPKIFKLFFSSKKSSGFGLWASRRYARANRGDLTFKSEPGQGATFILRLPVSTKGTGES